MSIVPQSKRLGLKATLCTILRCRNEEIMISALSLKEPLDLRRKSRFVPAESETRDVAAYREHRMHQHQSEYEAKVVVLRYRTHCYSQTASHTSPTAPIKAVLILLFLAVPLLTSATVQLL